MDFLFAPALAEETAKPNYVTDTLLKKLLNADISFWGMVIGLAALAAILFAVCKGRKTWTARTVAYGAMAIALSFVLSYIRVFRMPQGGSITPASMLPMMLFSAVFGIGPGVAAGLIYGVLQYLQGGDFLSVWQVIFDYLIAFAALGLAGLYRYMKQGWQIWLTLGLAAVLLVLVVGIVHTGLAYALYFGSMEGLRVQSIAVLSYIDPVCAVLFSALLLRESLSPLQAVGAVLILGSALAAERRPSGR
jgi:thiamine transporter